MIGATVKTYFLLLDSQSRALLTTKCKQFSLSQMICTNHMPRDYLCVPIRLPS